MPRTPSSRRGSNAGPATNAVVRAPDYAEPIKPKEAYAAIESVIVRKQSDIVQTLAKGIDPTTFLRVALQAITRTPKLLECSPASFVIALRDAAELGLMPSGLLGEGYLVPYRNKGQMEAQFQAGYLGLVKLARQSGEVLDVEARAVRERDELDIVYGSKGYVHHRPWIEGRSGPEAPGKYQGAWFRAKLANGEEHVGWMSVAQIELVRKRSKAADNGPWVTDYEAMMRKTVTRGELKWLPRSVSLQRYMESEDIIEGRAEVVTEAITISDAQKRLLAAGGIKVSTDPALATEPASDGPQQPEDADVADAATSAPDEPTVAPALSGEVVEGIAGFTCGNVADDGLMTGAICDLPNGHAGAHKQGDQGSWPV